MLSNGNIDRMPTRLFEELEANSLGDMNRDNRRTENGRLVDLWDTVASMAEDIAKIPVIEGEIRHINQNIGALRDHEGT